MRHIRYILPAVLALVLLSSSCNQAPESGQQTLTSTPACTITPQPPSATPSFSYTSTYTITQNPCNPSSAEFCIVEGTFLLQRPILPPGTDTVDRSYPYGSTAGGRRDPHHGVEFYNGSGTPVMAAADGTVYFAGNDSTSKFCPRTNFYGKLIILEHHLTDTVIYTLYAHLSKIEVSDGQSIRAGEKIGEVGASGSAIGSHLHFEVRLVPNDYNSTLNPELWLIPLPETGVLAMRFMDEIGRSVIVQSNVQYFLDTSSTPVQAWQPEPYAPEISQGNNWENALLGDLPAGQYRISYLWEGVLYERWVEIQSSKLTLVQLEVP
jgi:Peptidase family M23